ncbi:efflux RND transporter permease subunit [Stenomitos frigidus]|uniref:Hydrophobe/amphiphile efflux-1 family RND transporter n=1 Tax=Stenomitos frigidus ULC18 TaxID=2107698 RepID=A0A2T1E4U0_9CYAN|nr:efflux RND transporter permease subunit [Stenomitos frigidus]PSB27738.1 hydrophobe/amphiphile efflux-1 family RND transporter [Stenomitos frigidus ULC18]
MFADFFIRRPIFAIVCSLLIILVGAICIPLLPIAQYPDISPTQINVTSNYPGATAETVENAVTTILERQINGVEGAKYITSSSSNDGTSTITITFDAARNKDIAAVDVQNRIAVAEPQLPEAVRNTGVRVTKRSSNILLAIGFYAQNGEYDNTFMSNYADLYIVDALKRLKGVGDVTIFGERKYSMRLWVDPNKLASRGLTAQDVVTALQSQNIQVGAGTIGQQPSNADQRYQIDLQAVSRLTSVPQFENLVVKAGTGGNLVRLKDVGRVELGAQNYGSFLRYRGNDAVGIGIYQLPGSNALTVAEEVKAELAKLKGSFPPGLNYQVALDTTLYVDASLKEVVKTLFEAIVLVIIVIFFFLQDWRTTLIPTITIPVSLIGTFAFIKVFNFSINSLSLFGLTLATGLVVDDAIIVVENIARLIQERGMKPREATSQGMKELFGAVIATSLVLVAVFVPVSFFPGTTGQLYKQFALTIAFSIVLSTFNALTLSPALAAILLRQTEPKRNWLFDRFNWAIDRTRGGYARSLQKLVRARFIVLGVFALLLVGTGMLYARVPTAFLPEEDQGYFITLIQGPDGVSLNYTGDVMNRVEQEILKIPDVVGTFSVGGFSFSGNTANQGIIFTALKPWEERKKEGQSAKAILGQLRGAIGNITEARIIPVNPPAIQGLGTVGGFQFELQDRQTGGELDQLVGTMGQLVREAAQTPSLLAVYSTYSASTPQLQVEVDRNKAEALGVPVDQVFNTLQTLLGSQYVNDFDLDRRTYRVYIQADKQFRANPGNVGQLQVRSTSGQMIPLSNLVTLTPKVGAQTINHYNLFRSIEITGGPAPGFSSGQALKTMQDIAAKTLAPTQGYEWSGTSAEELASGGQAPLIFGLGIVFVFLVLAAQYESFIDPLIILLAVPLAILGAMLALTLRGLSNDVYSQIGLVMLIGLASKNAILIVEFANQLREQGLSITKAAIESSQERLRPILMTSFAFILGLLPLVFASGAGAASRRSLGTAVAGGMLVSTILSLFVVPILYIIIVSLEQRFKSRQGGGDNTPNGKHGETQMQPRSEVSSSTSDRS